MQRPKKMPVALEGVSETLLIPLWARAVESMRHDAIVRDWKALDLLSSLDYDFSKFKDAWTTQTGIAVRTKLFDDAVKAFLQQQPEAVLINLGAGLDTRFERIDNGRSRWYEVDLPEVIRIRHCFFEETERRRFIARSITDFGWIDEVRLDDGSPLIIAEGLLMYFDECAVREVFAKLVERFPGAEMVLEVLTPLAVGMSRYDPCVSKVGAGEVHFKWALRDCREIESWDGRIKLCCEWNVLDFCRNRWGWLVFLAPFMSGLLGNRIVRLRFDA